MLFEKHGRDLARRLRRVHARTVVESLVLMPSTAIMLRRLGYNRTRAVCEVLARLAAQGPTSPAPAAHAHKLVHSVDVVAMRFSPARTCLARALVVELLLRRAGFSPAVHFGVRRSQDEFGAHAWVELDGVVLGGPRGPYESLGVVNAPDRRRGAGATP